jgi:hypothetical protein
LGLLQVGAVRILPKDEAMAKKTAKAKKSETTPKPPRSELRKKTIYKPKPRHNRAARSGTV